MPARKPPALTNWHQTKAERQTKEAAHAVMTPKTQISEIPPKVLKKNSHAAATWRRLVGLYLNVEGGIINSFDERVLIQYCLAESELREMYKVRAEIKAMLDKHLEFLNSFDPKADQLKDYANLLAHANMLLERYQGMDGRIDGKRNVVFSMAQSLFLTPRSRGGIKPPEKPAEGPKSEMDRLLEEHT
jgi:hypothetical protein